MQWYDSSWLSLQASCRRRRVASAPASHSSPARGGSAFETPDARKSAGSCQSGRKSFESLLDLDGLGKLSLEAQL